MNLQDRINLLVRLGEFMGSDEPDNEEWSITKERAGQENGWFTRHFVDLAVENICNHFLKQDILEKWSEDELKGTDNNTSKTIGIVMAGNIPLVGFHDFLCTFVSGHKSRIKLSTKDSVLLIHLITKMTEWNSEINELVSFEEMLKGCDAYIATGSNNSSRYFEYYFKKYPHIIRKNRTSAGILDGTETTEELERLADDVHLYFGLGCRNVTKIYIPRGYDFIPLLSIFKKYHYFSEHNKYKNNYDYNLALHILNNKFYMTNESIILLENESLFSPVSQLHYEYYNKKEDIISKLSGSQDLQCLIGNGEIPFGTAQHPKINDYADGVNTMQFLASI